MKLSIILRCLNRLEYTIRSIVSIDELSGLDKNDYEIICVDQNSEDGTVEWLRYNSNEGYYPIVPVLLKENVGDGLGLNSGTKIAKGEFLCQHDNDIVLITPNYYKQLIEIYEKLEKEGRRVCSVAGSHKQGINTESAPFRFGRQKYGERNFVNLNGKEGNTYFYYKLYMIAWVTASFIFRREFASLEFGKGMCNSWCGEWFDRGYINFLCENIKFWHLDSDDRGGEYVKKQACKFPSYSYIRRNYRKFV